MTRTHPQERAWENEYRRPQMLSRKNVSHADVVRFMRDLKKEARRSGNPLDVSAWNVLDLGSGTGRNSFYFAEQGANVTGFEFSDTALGLARRFADTAGLSITYRKHDIGTTFPLSDAAFDLVLDVTSSNSLGASERQVYLSETSRVLKPDGRFFVRALCKEGDQHAKALIKRSPGPEPDTYMHPDLDIYERVFTESEFRRTYEPFFSIRSLTRSFHYTTVAGRRYKRAFWIAHLDKPYAA